MTARADPDPTPNDGSSPEEREESLVAIGSDVPRRGRNDATATNLSGEELLLLDRVESSRLRARSRTTCRLWGFATASVTSARAVRLHALDVGMSTFCRALAPTPRANVQRARRARSRSTKPTISALSRDDDHGAPTGTSPPRPGRRELAAGCALVALASNSRAANAGVLSDKLAAASLPGLISPLTQYDSPDLDYSFQYPKGWRVLRNRLRRGIVVADFDTTEKIVVEVFSRPPMSELVGDVPGDGDGDGDVPGGGDAGTLKTDASFASGLSSEVRAKIRARAVEVLVAPVADDNSGDSKLETPSMSQVRSLRFDAEGPGFDPGVVDYFAFTSTTTTRSGYQATRRNYAAVVPKGGLVYAICASATTADFDERRGALYERVIRTFVVN